MSNYTPTTSFTALTTIHAVISGAAVDVELANIATAIASKQDTSSAVVSIAGTANQITASSSTGAVVLSLPAAIAPVSGTFTGTLTGMTTTVTGTFNYEIIGKHCLLFLLNGVAGTSNATTMTLTGLPAACIPATAVNYWVPCYPVETNTGNSAGLANITSLSSSISIFPLVVSGSSVIGGTFANTGGKGLLAGWSIIYPLD